MTPLRLIALLLFVSGIAAAETLPDTYRVLVTRNVFNPNRGPGFVNHVAPPAPAPAPQPPATTVTLTGVAYLRGEATALFAGSTPSVAGTRRVGDALDTLKIDQITTEAVYLSGPDGLQITLDVGGSLKHVAGEPWTATDDRVAATAPIAPAAAKPDASSGGSAGGGDEASDILKMLLERRKQELQK